MIEMSTYTRAAMAGVIGIVGVSCGAPATVARPAGPAASPTISIAPVARGIDESIGLARDPRIAAAIADVDPAHIRRTDSALVSFGTRNTFSDTLSSTRGIGAARRWLY